MNHHHAERAHSKITRCDIIKIFVIFEHWLVTNFIRQNWKFWNKMLCSEIHKNASFYGRILEVVFREISKNPPFFEFENHIFVNFGHHFFDKNVHVILAKWSHFSQKIFKNDFTILCLEIKFETNHGSVRDPLEGISISVILKRKFIKKIRRGMAVIKSKMCQL